MSSPKPGEKVFLIVNKSKHDTARQVLILEVGSYGLLVEDCSEAVRGLKEPPVTFYPWWNIVEVCFHRRSY